MNSIFNNDTIIQTFDKFYESLGKFENIDTEKLIKNPDFIKLTYDLYAFISNYKQIKKEYSKNKHFEETRKIIFYFTKFNKGNLLESSEKTMQNYFRILNSINNSKDLITPMKMTLIELINYLRAKQPKAEESSTNIDLKQSKTEKRILKTIRIKEIAFSNPDLTYAQIAEKINATNEFRTNTSQDYVKTVMNRKSNHKKESR